VTVGPLITIVGPVFNEEDGIAEFHRRLTAVRNALPMRTEVVYVDDGSSDGSLEVLKSFHAADPSVRVIALSRNFGHQVAVSAGIEYASGDAVVCLDTDLQDQPEVIPELVARWQAGADVVSAVRRQRAGEPRWRLFAIRRFYRVIRRLTDLDIKFDSGDFRLMDRRVVDILVSMPERDRFVRGMTAWVGFKQDAVEYDRDARFAGESKYTISRLAKLAMAAITSFSHIPLQLAGAFGLVLSALCGVALPAIVVARLLGVGGLGGQTTVLVAVLLLSGVQLLFLGVFGEYLGRAYQELKRRPLFVIGYDSASPPSDRRSRASHEADAAPGRTPDPSQASRAPSNDAAGA
jgi:polyisoprenyl-phosphate glycosyltransferase